MDGVTFPRASPRTWIALRYVCLLSTTRVCTRRGCGMGAHRSCLLSHPQSVGSACSFPLLVSPGRHCLSSVDRPHSSDVAQVPRLVLLRVCLPRPWAACFCRAQGHTEALVFGSDVSYMLVVTRISLTRQRVGPDRGRGRGGESGLPACCTRERNT
ncbi:hypothetical protein M433DRAFT_139624 [Acidomyces richmondensis BFW]|nr:hypothetical protein M433DRAFT_139624 [Acidomyces richmondensis BFW]